MDLSRALRLDRSTRLALVGAGGKTTALFRLAREFAAPVLVSASAHLALEQTRLADQHLILHEPAEIEQVWDWIGVGVNLVTGPVVGERTRGLSFDLLSQLADDHRARDIPFLIEADGSRRLPLKAPAPHEPPIPPFVDTVLVVAGLSGIGKDLGTDWVYQPERFADLTGATLGDPVPPQALARLLLHPQGGLKNIPAQAQRVALLNQADTPALQSFAREMVPDLLRTYHAVLVAALKPAADQPGDARGGLGEPSTDALPCLTVHQPIAAIILAAGEGRRYGQLKQLLPWQGQPLVWHAASKALQAGLSTVVVVGGADFSRIESALNSLPVQLVFNPDWSQGQSTSVRVGIHSLPADIGAAVFLLADQPQIPVTLLQSLVTEHTRSMAPIIAPEVSGQRANPVLFDRDLFPALAALRGDIGGRALFTDYPPTLIPWHDRTILLDIDTPEDYHNLEDKNR